MQLPGMRDDRGDELATGVSLSDKISIYIECITVHTKLGQLHEAQQMVLVAQGMARGTPEEVRILIANSELALKRNDLDGALRMLNNVRRDAPAFVQAQVFKANVYLTHRHDRRAYAQCYLDLVSSSPSSANYVLLGEAYMRIQAPESAIEAFQTALDMNPSDNELAIKIGRALVSTHDYRKAMDYYESALVQSPNNTALRQDLSKLYTKLGKFNMASGILQSAIEYSGSLDDLASAISVVRNLVLMVAVYCASTDKSQVLDSLTRAWNFQRSVLERTRVERPDLLPEQRKIAADICHRMGVQYESPDVKDDDRAVESYLDALRIDEVFEPALLALARLSKRLNRLDDCERHCQVLLRVNAHDAEHASMLLGEVAFLRGDYEMATFHYQQLLEKKPNNYKALAKLISLLRGAAKLEAAEAFLKKAEKEDPRSASHSGLSFCKGLYSRYASNVTEAIKYFNLARKDGEWACRALENLVELYLNPDNELISEEDITAAEDSPAGIRDNSASDNLRVGSDA
jgi:tetratricopeptide repeat protein 21B